ncbi:MAG: hypothetical protein ACTSPY_04755 [Candidatus Helarchaeota archaeon]
MRNRCGRRRYNQIQNSNNRNNSRIPYSNRNFINNSNEYTYIGPCRCGLGPNAYYKRKNSNEIVSYTQIQNSTNKISGKSLNKMNSGKVNQGKNEAIKFCYNCGATLIPEAYYCSECGEYQGNDLSAKESVEDLKNQIKKIKEKIKNMKMKRGW